ncbi:MAG: glycosyltransferase family 2 protein [Desulfovibrio sp.]|jgi:glycosyltransferase involved in cell wall biosynthesis|nr:glycosyltransferase family 2 protein [Desulfovibrio sp.]
MSVTIIIPAYNVADNLRSTLDSICANTLVRQIIIVDDCSTDNTLAVIRHYADTDHRIQLLRTATNSGAGVARNLAIPHITEQYCAFIDADDTVTEIDAAAKLLDGTKADFLVYKWYYSDMYGKSTSTRMAESDEFLWGKVLRGKRTLQTNALRHPLIMRTLNFPWNKIYRTSFLQKNNISFSETFVHNDNLAHWMSYTLAASFILCNSYLLAHKEDARRTQISTLMDRRRLQLFTAFADIDAFYQFGALHAEFYPHFVCYKRDLLGWFGPQIQEVAFDEFCQKTMETFRNVRHRLLAWVNLFDPAAAADIIALRHDAKAFFLKKREERAHNAP